MALNTINKIAFLIMEICFMPLISVIVPVYKAENYLDRCVKSILSQTIRDLELILVEDGSPDRSGEICDDWLEKDSRVKVIHQENAGAGAARNAGLAIAQGDYIGFVDSDDWIHPQMYEVLYSSLSHNNCDMAMCGMINCNKYNAQILPVEIQPAHIKMQREMILRFFRVHGEDSSILQLGTKLIKSSVLKNFKFIEGTINEDVAATYYFVTHTYRTAIINNKLYNYFINKTGVTKSSVSMRDMEYIHAYKRIMEDVQRKYPDFKTYAYLNYIRSNLRLRA